MKHEKLKLDAILEAKAEKVIKGSQLERSRDRKEKHSHGFFKETEILSPNSFVKRLNK